jgi:hypothetical protein
LGKSHRNKSTRDKQISQEEHRSKPLLNEHPLAFLKLLNNEHVPLKVCEACVGNDHSGSEIEPETEVIYRDNFSSARGCRFLQVVPLFPAIQKHGLEKEAKFSKHSVSLKKTRGTYSRSRLESWNTMSFSKLKSQGEVVTALFRNVN